LKNAAHIDTVLTIGVGQVGPIAHQAAGVRKIAPLVNCWHLVTGG